MHGKNAIIKSSGVMVSNTLYPPPVCFFDFGKQINHIVGLTEIVLYVVIFRRDA